MCTNILLVVERKKTTGKLQATNYLSYLDFLSCRCMNAKVVGIKKKKLKL